MLLSEFVARRKRELFAEILADAFPREGRCDQARLSDLRARGKPQMGTTHFKPELIVFEFIFSLEGGETEVVPVEVDPPFRIVHLPVPEWVVESIWQGEVQGSYHFEPHARELLDKLALELDPLQNAKWFGARAPRRRE